MSSARSYTKCIIASVFTIIAHWMSVTAFIDQSDLRKVEVFYQQNAHTFLCFCQGALYTANIYLCLFHFYCTFAGLAKIVQILIEKGAKLDAVNKDGFSVLDNASSATTGNLTIIPTKKSMNGNSFSIS